MLQGGAQRRAPRELGYRGHQVLAFVRTTIATHGQAPSYRMICNELGIGDKTDVARIVSRLEKRGLLRRVGAGRVHRISIS